MSYFNKFIAFLFINVVLIQSAFASSAKVKVVDMSPWLNKKGVYYNSQTVNAGSELSNINAVGFKLAIAFSVLAGLAIMVTSIYLFTKSQSNGQVSSPKTLFSGLIIGALLISVVSSVGLVTGLNCNANNVQQCAAWSDANSGLSGDMKERVDKIADGGYAAHFDRFKEKYYEVISCFQWLALCMFAYQLVRLFLHFKGSGTREGCGGILILAFVAALVVDLPHTVEVVSTTADKIIKSYDTTSTTK